jgi:hypothetical protein
MSSSALGGRALNGEELLRFVYVDEAGISRAKDEPFVVVAGAIVHADRSLTAIERHFDRLRNELLFSEDREFVFHVKEMMNGGKILKREKYPFTKRLEMIEAISKLPSKFNIQIALGIVPRADFSSVSNAHVMAYLQCCMFVEYWMRENAPNEVCAFIVEDNSQMRKLIKAVHIQVQDRNIEIDLHDQSFGYFPFTHIKEDPLFQEKKKHSPIQISDTIAYIYKRKAMGNPPYWLGAMDSNTSSGSVRKRWRKLFGRRRSVSCVDSPRGPNFHVRLSFVGDRLEAGAEQTIGRVVRTASDAAHVVYDGGREYARARLAALYQRPIDDEDFKELDRAAAHWARGDNRMFAYFYLLLAKLGEFDDAEAAASRLRLIDSELQELADGRF